jgi:hypothetical protein
VPKENPRSDDASIDRFIWKDGDVKIIHDPSKDPNRRRMRDKKKPHGPEDDTEQARFNQKNA